MRWVRHAARSSACPTTRPIAGFRNNTVNTLRLWQARAGNEFDLEVFNDGDYVRAVEDKNVERDHLQGALPERQQPGGTRAAPEAAVLLRRVRDLATSCAATRRLTRRSTTSPSKNAIQLNDTHPAIAVAELMRVLVDLDERALGPGVGDHGRDLRLHEPHAAARRRSSAGRWRCSSGCCRGTSRSSTRSTAASCARCMARFPGDDARIARMSIIEEGAEKQRAHGAPRGRRARTRSTASRRCTRELLKRDVLRDFAEMWPEKFTNKTNGVTPRRWLWHCNPRALARSSPRRIGAGWVTRPRRARAPVAASPTTRRFVERVARRQAREQGATSRSACSETLGVALRPGLALRRADQAPPRVQAAAPERAARRARSTSREARSEGARRCRARCSSAARRRPATAWRS